MVTDGETEKNIQQIYTPEYVPGMLLIVILWCLLSRLLSCLLSSYQVSFRCTGTSYLVYIYVYKQEGDSRQGSKVLGRVLRGPPQATQGVLCATGAPAEGPPGGPPEAFFCDIPGMH